MHWGYNKKQIITHHAQLQRDSSQLWSAVSSLTLWTGYDFIESHRGHTFCKTLLEQPTNVLPLESNKDHLVAKVKMENSHQIPIVGAWQCAHS